MKVHIDGAVGAFSLDVSCVNDLLLQRQPDCSACIDEGELYVADVYDASLRSFVLCTEDFHSAVTAPGLASAHHG